jgi:deoxyribose-phosphate aldolase
MDDNSKLQELAEAANAVIGSVSVEMTIASEAGPNQAEIDAVTAFMGASTPAAVLELITRNKELANEVTVAEFQKKILGEALRKDRAEIERLRTAEGDAMTYKAGMENVAQQRDQLKAEVEAFKAANAELSKTNVARRNHLSNAKKAAGISPMDDLVGTIEALRKDAERYRYMRDFPYNNIARAVGIADGCHFWLQFEEADKAIDKAKYDDAELLDVMSREPDAAE